jgi:hypothetical protein
MPLNLREGTKRLGIVVSVLGGVAGAIGGYLLVADAYALTSNRFLQESVLVEDCVVALLLPILGFLVPWEVIHFLVWISSALSGQPTAHGRSAQFVPRKRPGTAREVGPGHEAKRSAAKRRQKPAPKGG